ncbi:glycosyltransferase family 39 protein [Deferribacter thermophilus]|uniref:ArnT family glycosyltransferase n=1 Tax=Deferribacter thermophilus TaxID=53573 RepID=UPI003C288473
MTNKKKIYIFLIFYFLISIYPLKYVPLFETTEARYAEIAREMVVSGDFIEPRFNGIKHFHKPPFAYWMIAAGIKIFGVNGLGARFFGVFAAVISIFFLYRLSKLFLENEEDCYNTALIYATNFLFIAISRITSTDIYLTMWTVIAQYLLFKQIYHEKSYFNALLYGATLGFGFLTKGPIIFLFTIFPFFVAKFFDKNHRKVFSLKETFLSIVMFLFIALPWYIAVIIKNPELLNYFLKVQTVDRVVTNRFHRYKPFYFFIFVFIGGFLPYTFYFFNYLKRLRSVDVKLKTLFIYFIAPFIIFSIAKSKLETYILPIIPVSSIMAYYGYKNLNKNLFRYLIIGILFVIAFGIMISGYLYPPLNDFKKTSVLYGILAMFTVSLAIINLKTEKFLSSVAFSMIAFTFIVYLVLPVIGPNIKGYRQMSLYMNKIDPKNKIDVLVYKGFIPSISYYRNKLAIIAFGKEREIQFEKDNFYKNYYLTSFNEVKSFVNKRDEFFLVTRPKYINEFKSKFLVSCSEIFKQRKYSAYLCKRLKR